MIFRIAILQFIFSMSFLTLNSFASCPGFPDQASKTCSCPNACDTCYKTWTTYSCDYSTDGIALNTIDQTINFFSDSTCASLLPGSSITITELPYVLPASGIVEDQTNPSGTIMSIPTTLNIKGGSSPSGFVCNATPHSDDCTNPSPCPPPPDPDP